MLGEHPDVVDEVGEERRDDTPVTSLGRRGGASGRATDAVAHRE